MIWKKKRAKKLPPSDFNHFKWRPCWAVFLSSQPFPPLPLNHSVSFALSPLEIHYTHCSALSRPYSSPPLLSVSRPRRLTSDSMKFPASTALLYSLLCVDGPQIDWNKNHRLVRHLILTNWLMVLCVCRKSERTSVRQSNAISDFVCLHFWIDVSAAASNNWRDRSFAKILKNPFFRRERVFSIVVNDFDYEWYNFGLAEKPPTRQAKHFSRLNFHLLFHFFFILFGQSMASRIRASIARS